ncbi:hypothetical protein LIA77_04921 [Sarocladium implicatum]|nr:hypothetical protein LIA77_04921 [Sarocladium implicatum]
MHFTTLLTLSSAVGVFAVELTPLKRQTLVKIPCVELGEKDCGNVCIPLSYTCCPNRAGGCGLGFYCDATGGGEYGCCPLGEICTGPGGAVTYESTRTSTSTIVNTATIPVEEPPEEPTEVPEEPTEVPEEPTEPPYVPDTTTEIPEVPETTTYPPVEVPSPPPSNGTGKPTETGEEPPVVTGGAAVKALGLGGAIGGLIGIVGMLL